MIQSVRRLWLIWIVLLMTLCQCAPQSIDQVVPSTVVPTPAESATVPASPTNTATPAPELPIVPTLVPAPTKPPLTPTPMAEPPMPESSLILLYYGSDGHLYRTDSAASFIRQLTSVPDRSEEGEYVFFRPPRVSPDGRWLALNGGWGGAALLDLAEGKAVGVGRGGAMQAPVWSPDSQSMAYLGRDNKLCIVGVPDLVEDCPFQDVRQLQEVVWSPNGLWIAVALADPAGEDGNCCTGQVLLFNPADGSAEVVGTFATTFEPIVGDSLAWLPNGSGLLIKNTADSGSAIFKPETGVTVSFAQPIVSVSPDGRHLLASSGLVSDVDGAALYSLPLDGPDCAGGSSKLAGWAWSFDGRRLAYHVNCKETEGTWLSVVETDTGSLLWGQALSEDMIVKAWTPDDDYLLFQKQAGGLLEDASILRLAADGPGEMIPVVEGLFIEVVPAWGD